MCILFEPNAIKGLLFFTQKITLETPGSFKSAGYVLVIHLFQGIIMSLNIDLVPFFLKGLCVCSFMSPLY